MHNKLTSPESQSATFIELFFDLVYVFSVTQVVYLVAHEFTWLGVLKGVLVFWLVWWSWTQFTWSLNAANTEHSLIQFLTLFATIVAFMMAIAIPNSFEDKAVWFITAYIVTRIIGLSIYILVERENQTQIRALRVFTFASLFGLAVAFMGGWLGGTWQYVLWVFVIVLDIIAAGVGGNQEGWDLFPEHFSERHGLFVIIALGESLIIVASGISQTSWDIDLLLIALLAVTITCLFWWNYFHQTKPFLDSAFERAESKGQHARDVYSLMHFFVILGIIALAVGTEVIMAHPDDPVDFSAKLSLAAGFSLFIGGLAAAVWRAKGTIHLTELAVQFLAIAFFLLLPTETPLEVLVSLFAVTVGIVTLIHVHTRKHLHGSGH